MYPILDWLQNIQQDAFPNLKRRHCDADTAKRRRPGTPESLPVQAAAAGPSGQEHIQPAQGTDKTPIALSCRSQSQSAGVSSEAAFPPSEVLVRRDTPGCGRPTSSEKNKVKTLPELARKLAVPVRYTFELQSPDFLAPSAAGTGTTALYRRLLLIEKSHGILPSGLRNPIEVLVSPNSLLPFMWSTTTTTPARETQPIGLRRGIAGISIDGSTQPLRELESIDDIVTKTCEGFENGFTEASWNSTVHQKVLELAMAPYPCRVCNVTHAAMAEPFRPRMANSDDAASLATSSNASSTSSTTNSQGDGKSFHKMADFALQLSPGLARRGGEVPALTALVRRYLATQPIGEQSINAMNYEHLRDGPAAVFVETKSGTGKSEDSKIQLGICVAGWHNRMRRILDQAKRTGSAAHVIATPALFVFEADWEVRFVVDGRSLTVPCDEIHVVGPALKLGSTSSLVGTYQLLAGLRCIVDWMDTDFREWISEALQDALAS